MNAGWKLRYAAAMNIWTWHSEQWRRRATGRFTSDPSVVAGFCPVLSLAPRVTVSSLKYASMPLFSVNWRGCRTLLLAIIVLGFVSHYFYVDYKPPTALYDDFFQEETRKSEKLLHNNFGNKYVKFKQLQGAGFNNQVKLSCYEWNLM